MTREEWIKRAIAAGCPNVDYAGTLYMAYTDMKGECIVSPEAAVSEDKAIADRGKQLMQRKKQLRIAKDNKDVLVQARVDTETRTILLRLGGGNLSLGIRRAALQASIPKTTSLTQGIKALKDAIALFPDF